MNDRTERQPDIWDKVCQWILGNMRTAAAAAGIAALVILGLVLIFSPRAIDKGSDAQNDISWVFCSDGTLKFEGSGEIVGMVERYVSGSGAPEVSFPDWYEHREKVTSIELGRQISYVGMDSFVGFSSLEELTVCGSGTELDIDCIRRESPAQQNHFLALIVWGKSGSSAEIYAEFNGLEFRPL